MLRCHGVVHKSSQLATYQLITGMQPVCAKSLPTRWSRVAYVVLVCSQMWLKFLQCIKWPLHESSWTTMTTLYYTVEMTRLWINCSVAKDQNSANCHNTSVQVSTRIGMVSVNLRCMVRPVFLWATLFTPVTVLSQCYLNWKHKSKQPCGAQNSNGKDSTDKSQHPPSVVPRLNFESIQSLILLHSLTSMNRIWKHYQWYWHEALPMVLTQWSITSGTDTKRY